MLVTFRTKILFIVGAAAAAFLILIVVGSLLERKVGSQLGNIKDRYLPLVDLGPQLQARFEQIRRSLQDAVAAQDAEALAATRDGLKRFHDHLATAQNAISTTDAQRLREAVDDYYQTAYEVSRRLIGGEKGEALVDAMNTMQRKHAETAAVMDATTAFDRHALTEAFSIASRAQSAAGHFRLLVSVGCLLLVILLALGLSRGVLVSLAQLGAGVQRFGRGDFSQPIRVTRRDELGTVAEQANHMADSLKRLSDDRDHRDWIKAGEAGLAVELRGDLEPEEVASRAVRFLARYLDAPAAALYYANRDRILVLLGQYALGPSTATAELPPHFRLGEGLVGQAALHDGMVVLPEPPADYLRVRSGLGESAPRALVLLPLVHAGKVTGVLELAMFKPWSDLFSELMMAVRETVAIALEVATARASLRDLLLETQRQAQRLVTQEEELRAANEELQGQQEELRMSNEQMRERGIELEKQRRTLEDRNGDLLQVRHRLEQKAIELTTISTYKSQFLANMSHELRTPLNSMLLLSNLLMQNQSGNLTEKQVEFCRTINGAGKDLLALINQVLDLAKIESGKQTANIEPVPLRPLVERCEQVFGPVARDKGLTLIVEVAPDAPQSVATDRQRLDQILNNLLGNAIKFTHQGEVALRIRTAPAEAVRKLKRTELIPGRTLMLSVSDTGIGIPAQDRERIFQPFEQVDGKSDRRYGGTGLGLPIARELANLLGGELQIESDVGRGSTFVCYLPYESQAATTPEPPASFPVPGPPVRPLAVRDDEATLEPDDRCLLIIEDDAAFAEIFGEVIHEQNLKYLIASDGQTGLRLAREKKPTGIILDVRLPDVDGWTVMERLRADPVTSTIPVHFVTGMEAGERGMAMGAVGYVTKPTSRRDLLRVIQALTPGPAERPRILVVEDDQDLADSLMQRLGGENLDVARVASARAALDALSNARYDCMILDLSLPDMDGLDLLESLQKWAPGTAPPVLVYTGRALSKQEAKRVEAYAEAVVLKEGPSADRLIDEVRMFVGRLRGGRPGRRVAEHLHPRDVSLTGRRVLVVDDDMRTVYALSALLRAKGVEVLVADTGLAALATLLQHPDVEAVLMDIMMPEMDGYEAMRQIRQQERFRELPVIALTAKAMKGDRVQCLEAGATDYLSKPIDADRLLEMLHTRLSARPDHGNGKRS